ncbi:MAG: Phosphate metabolism transcription protein [Chaenotheca gracillima]|nr:MAG: Phosphate metabolism transcription protein [Chaenotheca gracillima]
MEHLREHRSRLLAAYNKEFAQLENDLRADIAKESAKARCERPEVQVDVEVSRKAADRVEELEEQNVILREELRRTLAGLPQRPETPSALSSSGIPRESPQELTVTSGVSDRASVDWELEYRLLETRFERLKQRSEKNLKNYQAWKMYWQKEDSARRRAARRSDAEFQGSELTKPQDIDGSAKRRSQPEPEVNCDPQSDFRMPPLLATSPLPIPGYRNGGLTLEARDHREFCELPSSMESEAVRATAANSKSLVTLGDDPSSTPLPASSSSTCLDSEATQGAFDQDHGSPIVKTEEEPTDLVGTKRNLSPDLPVIYAERSVKRRRQDRKSSPHVRKEASSGPVGTSHRPIQVKDEPMSSSPLAALGFPNHDSLDLDEVYHAAELPTKEGVKHNPGIGIPALEPRKQIQSSALDVELHTPSQLKPVPRVVQGKAEPIHPRAAGPLKASVLQPKSNNMRLQPRMNSPKSSNLRASPSKAKDSGASHISALAEDGDEDLRRRDYTQSRAVSCPEQNSPEVPHADRIQLLKGLLDRSPQKRTPLASRTSQSVLSMPSPRNVLEPQCSPSLRYANGNNQPHQQSGLSVHASDIQRQSNAPSAHGAAFSASKPFRMLPNSGLTPESFKVNPHFNAGVSFAFSETVRGHDDRRRLPGCTGSGCCGGAIRKLVELGDLSPSREQGPRWNSDAPTTAEEAEERLLLDYLGSVNRHELEHMSEHERRELLIQAKTKQFADQHGRHRHRFERKKTPPGFWRTDMPTTQELEQDQATAEEMERAVVETRRREAMREGGRWIFRDE